MPIMIQWTGLVNGIVQADPMKVNTVRILEYSLKLHLHGKLGKDIENLLNRRLF